MFESGSKITYWNRIETANSLCMPAESFRYEDLSRGGSEWREYPATLHLQVASSVVDI